MAFIIGCVIISIAVIAIGLTVAVGLWLDSRGGAWRWQIWLMAVFLCAIFGADLFLAVQPFDLRLIGLGAGLGMIVGAILGLFVKNPSPAQRNRQRR